MSFIEFIGFVISIAAMGFLMVKRYFEEKKRRQNPELYAESEAQKEEHLKEFLHSINLELEDETFSPPRKPQIPPPPPIQHRKLENQPRKENLRGRYPFSTTIESYKHETQIEKRQLKSSIEDRRLSSFEERLNPLFVGEHNPYEIVQKDQEPRIQKLVGDLPSLRKAILLKEILSPPKGLEGLEP